MARNNAIQIRRGADGSVPTGSMVAGEPLFSTDNAKFYIATNATTKSWVGATILDQDDMSGNSATSLATQQSIKAYVDAQVTAQDLDISADSGSNIAIDLDSEVMAVTGGEGIDTSISGNAITIAGEDASTSNKGVASFSSDNFAASSGVITVKDGGIANAELAGSIANAKLANSSTTVSDGSNSTAISLGSTMTFSGTSNEVTVAESSGTVTIGLPDDVTIAGDLTVSGDTVTTNVATVSIEDPLVSYANGNTGNAVDIGFYGKYRTNGTDLYLGLAWNADQTEFILFEGNQAAPTTTVNIAGTGYALSDLRLGAVHAATLDGGTY